MQIFYENSTIHLQTIANTLFDLKQKIADQIQELKDREFILIMQKQETGSIKLLEEVYYKDIIANIKQKINVFCFSIMKFLDYKEFYNRILEAINLTNKQMQQNQYQGMKLYQQENSKIQQSRIETLLNEEKKQKNSKSSFQDSTLFRSQTTSQLKPKSQSYEIQSKFFVQNSESDLNERDIVVSRNYNSTIFVDKETQCWKCNIFIKTKSISLNCHHTYHQECFQELLQQQLEQKKLEIQCMCNKKIPKISYHLGSMGSYFKEKYFNNQLEVLKQKYQKSTKSCTQCKQFFIVNKTKNIQSYCLSCEQFSDFN